MRILLIRHGESENNVRSYSSSKLGESLPDPGLSEKGILQVFLLLCYFFPFFFSLQTKQYRPMLLVNIYRARI